MNGQSTRLSGGFWWDPCGWGDGQVETENEVELGEEMEGKESAGGHWGIPAKRQHYHPSWESPEF